VVSLDVLFYIFILLFAVIGSMRGFAKEVLVTFAILLSIFLITVIEAFVPIIRDNLVSYSADAIFWMRMAILGVLVVFGYQSPNLPRLAESNRFVKERFQDLLLGFFMGALNGYLIWGTVWYYLNQSNYPLGIIIPPVPGTEIGNLTKTMMPYLPPAWLGQPIIYFAVAIAFIFVLVVFI
jgi:uncharacterized membrane protein required for colicin V production